MNIFDIPYNFVQPFTQGVEIGALHYKFYLKEGVVVKYIDVESKAKLMERFKNEPTITPELIPETDIITHAEDLSMIADNSKDFVLSSHVLEHCLCPGKAIKEWLRIVNQGGLVFFITPDKRLVNSDKDHEATSFETLMEMYNTPIDKVKYQTRTNFDHTVFFEDKILKQFLDHLQKELNFSISIFGRQDMHITTLLIKL